MYQPSEIDKLLQLVEEIKEAEGKYIELLYQYRQVIDQINEIDNKIVIKAKSESKTQKAKRAELYPMIQELQHKKRRLEYESNRAKMEFNYLQRKYQILFEVYRRETVSINGPSGGQ